MKRTQQLLGIALLAILCACPAKVHNKVGGPMPRYFIARVNIPQGAQADYAVRKGWFEGIVTYEQQLQPGAIKALSEIHGKIALQKIPKGSEILGQEFGAPSPPTGGPPNKPTASR
jgi:hypothetical protein